MAITVNITDDSSTENVISNANNPIATSSNENKSNQKISGKKSPVKAMMISVVTSQAKSWASAGIQAYTKYTGHTRLQKKIDIALQATSNVGSVIGGLAVGGIAGGFVTAGAAVAKYGMDEFNNYIENKISNRTISINNEGLGNRNINGGRYGA